MGSVCGLEMTSAKSISGMLSVSSMLVDHGLDRGDRLEVGAHAPGRDSQHLLHAGQGLVDRGEHLLLDFRAHVAEEGVESHVGELVPGLVGAEVDEDVPGDAVGEALGGGEAGEEGEEHGRHQEGAHLEVSGRSAGGAGTNPRVYAGPPPLFPAPGRRAGDQGSTRGRREARSRPARRRSPIAMRGNQARTTTAGGRKSTTRAT